MCPISSHFKSFHFEIACLWRLLFCWSFEGKNEQLSFELFPGLKYLFCNVGPTRHLRTPIWVGRCWCRPFHVFPGAVPEISLDHPQGSTRLLDIDEIWSDHFNLLSTVIPRYDAESTCSSLDPQKKYDRWGGHCLFEIQMMLHLEVELIAWRRLEVKSRNVAISIPCDYVMRQMIMHVIKKLLFFELG